MIKKETIGINISELKILVNNSFIKQFQNFV